VIAAYKFRHPEFRERVTGAILEMLAHLPEIDRNIFIWKHYRGYHVKQIAEILRCSPPEIEATLGAVNSILYQITRAQLAENPQLDTEINLPSHGTLQEVGDCR